MNTVQLKSSHRKVLHFENQHVIHGSSEAMLELEDNSIDVIVTSPPYNIGKKYATDPTIFTDRLPLEEYLNFLQRVFKECYRVLKPNGVFFLNIGDSARDQGKSEKVVNAAVHVGFQRLQTVIWVKSIFGKGHYTPSGGNRRLNNVWENVFLLVKSKKYVIDPKRIGVPYTDKSNVGRFANIDLRDPGDVWFIPYEITTGASKKKGHEAPFPIGLPYQCINLVPHATSVLDPFAGTGSTLAAARHHGITGIGYELFPNEELLKKRILETPFEKPKTPLLPQLESYADLIDKLLAKAVSYLNDQELQELGSILRKQEKKRLKWYIKDLERDIPWKQLLDNFF